jgi:pilus assembly protein CpaB
MDFPRVRRRLADYNKTWLVLIAGLAVGALAAVAGRSYLTAQVAAIERRSKIPMVDVVVAKTELAVGTRLNRENVAVRKIPKEYVHSTAISPTEFERIDGHAVASAMGPGDMILWGLVETKRAKGNSREGRSSRHHSSGG